jgi:hypothetical protein
MILALILGLWAALSVSGLAPAGDIKHRTEVEPDTPGAYPGHRPAPQPCAG